MQFLSNYGYSPSWVKRLKRETKRFIEYIDRMGLSCVSEIKGEHISGYIETQIGYSQGEISAKLVCLKQLFKFLYTNKFHEVNLVLFTPKCRVFPRTKLPTVWEKDDIDKILASVDRGNPSGKRDYAIIMLAAKLGLRVSDIRNLQLNELNWDNQSIELIQTKTGLPLTLPMLPDVGWAIIDYLKSGRPITTTQNVFVRHQSPFIPFADGTFRCQ